MNAHKLRNKFFMVCTGKETENMFMMPIDTGNKAIKTENFEFNSGITMLADVPGENEEALMYQGRYYRLSHERNVYLPDKTMDDRYYLLTLFAIAKELEEMSHSKSFIPGELISMDLVVGLPPLYYRGQYKKFREYFYRDGKIVHFVYMGKSYRVTFSNVFVHMQTYAACSLFFSLFSIDVFAKTDKNQEDPETVQWKERESYAENFTDTEQPSATLALRTECFTGFTGKISVTIQKENGASRQYELSEDNLYEQNIPVNTGIYMVKSVEAADEECVYKTEYSQEELKVKPDQLLLLKIMVMEEEIGTVAEIQKEKSENSLHTEIKETVDEENIIKTLLEEDQGSVKYLLGIGILSGTALVIGLLVRKKRNKYD